MHDTCTPTRTHLHYAHPQKHAHVYTPMYIHYIATMAKAALLNLYYLLIL